MVYPDVIINNETFFSYDATTGVLTMMHPPFSSITGDDGTGGIDEKIVYKPGPGNEDDLTVDLETWNIHLLTTCNLSITVNPDTGELISGTMEEIFHLGSENDLPLESYPVEKGGPITLDQGTTLLSGTVTSFWVEVGGTKYVITVDYPTSGAGVWAEGGTDVNNKSFKPIFPKFPVGVPDLIIEGNLLSGTWDKDWYKSSFIYDPDTGQGGKPIKSDKYPTPEPATLLLLGTGIAGIAGAVTRRRKKK